MKRDTTTIRGLAYELYKLDWMRRISAERQMDALKDYYQEVVIPGREQIPNAYDGTSDIVVDGETFEKWIEEQGFSGELYVCFDEFLGAEYQDAGYMKELFDNDVLFAEYQEDMNGKQLKYEIGNTPMRTITVYCDSTDLFTEEEAEVENLALLDFPEEVIEGYFQQYIVGYADLKDWLENYTADETEGLYDFAVEKGFRAKR